MTTQMKFAFVASLFSEDFYELEILKWASLNSTILALSFIPSGNELCYLQCPEHNLVGLMVQWRNLGIHTYSSDLNKMCNLTFCFHHRFMLSDKRTWLVHIILNFSVSL